MSNETKNDDLTVYTVQEVMEILKASHNTVLKLLRDGKLKGFKLGNYWRVSATNLKAFMNGER